MYFLSSPSSSFFSYSVLHNNHVLLHPSFDNIIIFRSISETPQGIFLLISVINLCVRWNMYGIIAKQSF